MLASVTGIYENGQVILDEDLPVKTAKAKIIVTLVEEIDEEPVKPERRFGILKGTFTGDYWFSKEFNDPIDGLKDYM